MEQYPFWPWVIGVMTAISVVLGVVVSKVSTDTKVYYWASFILEIMGFFGISTFKNEGKKEGFEAKLPFTTARPKKK